MTTEALAELCRSFGIDTEYHDIFGTLRRVPDDALITLLRCLGADDRQMEQALVERQNQEWRRSLPAYLTVRGREMRPRVVLAQPIRERGRLRWRVQLEDGVDGEGALQADFEPDTLAATETREIDGEPWERRILELPAGLPFGYHTFSLERAEQVEVLARTPLIVAPAACHVPVELSGNGRVWGIGVQLHSLRSPRNWGIGDFTDLHRLIELAAEMGASFVGLNPLHALFPHNPAHASPYSPSSRSFLNFLYLDVEAVPELADSTATRERIADEAFQARLRALRASELIDYVSVAAAKREVLEALFDELQNAPDTPRARAFEAFRRAEGDALRRHAEHEALQDRAHGNASAEFFEYLQWETARQLQDAAAHARELGLPIGLYRDVAVGVNAAAAETWTDPTLFALDARIGAPPDEFNREGQDWGLPPWRPDALIERAFEPFVRLLRRNMQSAGAIRIDHVMALDRLFWIPPDVPATDGAYVHYPLEALLAIVTLESHRARCVVVGEDLGTVPDVVREALASVGVYSNRLLYFEREADGSFKAPASYPRDALVSIGTHDLPTLRGFWEGTDVALRQSLGLLDEEGYGREVLRRNDDRARLLLALLKENLLPEDITADPTSVPAMTPALARALTEFVARTPSHMLLISAEDLLEVREQVNLPGTVDEHPNWRRKLPLDVSEWANAPDVAALGAMLRTVRPRGEPTAHIERASCPDEARIPLATYRLQFQGGFGFRDAAALVPYLATLGVSHCYTSPLLRARKESPHGYDIIDHASLNPELGDAADFDAFVEQLQAHGMALLMDVVPNHMGVGRENLWWQDVLENGRASPYAGHFDIDWEPLKEELRNKVLLPLLGDHYGNVLDRGELALVFDAEAGSFDVGYFEHVLPVDPQMYPRILSLHRDQLAMRIAHDEARVEFESLVTAFDNLPHRDAAQEERVLERQRDKEILKRRLAALYRQDADIARYVHDCLDEYNGRPGRHADTERMHALLESQAYRLAYWRVAAEEINYRRFFDINELAALRMERPAVFDATHALVLDLVAKGKVAGLRIDHPDGLYDPRGYFEQLQARAGRSDAQETGALHRPLYVVAEKILQRDERLPADWPIHGTTGYDFARDCADLLVDADARPVLQRAYEAFLGERPRAGEVWYESRKLIMRNALVSELAVLTNALERIAESDPHTRDFTPLTLQDALREIVACFPVYRTYVDARGASEADERCIAAAVDEAIRRNPATESSIFQFVHEALLARIGEGRPEEYRNRVLRFAMSFQQYTGPVVAKGVEDTGFYRYNLLVSLNEVGGDPSQLGSDVATFHARNIERARSAPHGLLASSTHDTKRSEDVRARIHALSQLAEEWERRVAGWQRKNRPLETETRGGRFPDLDIQYLLYQTLLGIWPDGPGALEEACAEPFRKRVRSYMGKAAREAKRFTSWTRPNDAYERALSGFVDGLLDRARSGAFLDDFGSFAPQVAHLGRLSSLSQTLLKLTCPGVPDIYQGNETWDWSLVDPDNRRPVDFSSRARALEELERAAARSLSQTAYALMQTLHDGRAKLFLEWRALALRRRSPDLFAHGDYVPLIPRGCGADQLCAYARNFGNRAVVVVTTRRHARLIDAARSMLPVGPAVWHDTRIPAGTLADVELENVLDGTMHRASREHELASSESGAAWQAADLLQHWPIALLATR